MSSIFNHYQSRYEALKEEEYSLQEYLDICKRDRMAYATAAERMLYAIGEAELVDTSRDPRMSRMFSNKVIRRYPAFAEFYGMEECIEQIVSFFRHAAQGLEESKQVLYLLGPVGGGKSSLAERLKALIEKAPIYSIKGSPINESPLGLFTVEEDGAILEEDFGIAPRYLKTIMSPWAVKRLHEYGGDITRFRVVKRYPSRLNQIAVSKTEPGDENNQDISSLVGKVDIRTGRFPAKRYGRVQLFRRLVLIEPRFDGIRGNVQSADQGAAPLADRDARRQFQRHGKHRRHPVQRSDSGAFQRIRMADLQEQSQ